MHISFSGTGWAAVLFLLLSTLVDAAPTLPNPADIQAERAVQLLSHRRFPDSVSTVITAARRLVKSIQRPPKDVRALQKLARKSDSDLVKIIKDRADDSKYQDLIDTATGVFKGEKEATPIAQAQAARLLKMSVEEGRYPLVAAAFHSMDVATLSDYDLGRVGLRAKPTFDRESGMVTGAQIFPADPVKVNSAMPKGNHFDKKVKSQVDGLLSMRGRYTSSSLLEDVGRRNDRI
ncbi:hypothetical protein FRB96_002281 [Tulasnella sp. 330]|nr:hypothetical protein FRB96_002281 [Tulasnella sp. 330]KAG8887016.1 hypothetical protein FRB98_000641 [Tulasnella sp. 332]